MAMSNHTLRSRLRRLERSIEPELKPLRFAIHLVDVTGEITKTLFIEPGREDRWLPGKAPPPEDWVQTAADGGR